MKKIALLAASFFIASSLYAQQIVDLQEKIPYQYNGFEFGYYITNEKSKEVKGDDMNRYEIVLYVTNKSNSLRIIPFPSIENVEDELPYCGIQLQECNGQTSHFKKWEGESKAMAFACACARRFASFKIQICESTSRLRH
jgi:hypothetical protein